MSIVVNIYYSGENGSARKFAKEMISSGTVNFNMCLLMKYANWKLSISYIFLITVMIGIL